MQESHILNRKASLSMTEAPVDVLIIGAGPAGGAAGKQFVEAGFSVVCLEQGDWPDPAAYRGPDPEWELTKRKQWSWDPNIRQSVADYAIDLSRAPGTTIMNFNGVGGSAVLFAGIWPRFTPANFDTQSRHGFADDWPLSYEELLPYYERTDREVGVSGLGGNPAYPDGVEPPLPPMPIQSGGLLLARAFSRLGWQWWPDTNAILSAPYKGRNPCVQRGTCSSGCSEGAKGSADVAYWRPITKSGGKVITGARVHRIQTDGRGLATGAEWFGPDGVGHFQAADLVICAANGIGTPRLLLASHSPQHPDGLANGSGQLGRNLMFHPQAAVTGLFDEQLESWQGHSGSWIGSWEFYESDSRRGFVGSAKWQVGPTGGPLAHALPAAGAGVWGPNHHDHITKRLGRAVSLVITGEELPMPENRVELSKTITDPAGLPVPEIVYAISTNSKIMMQWHCEQAIRLMKEAGAISVETNAMIPHFGHLMGTARMGNNPATSVVDRWGIAHDIPNLAVVDGSTFVTSAGVNPTSTICALASRTAEYLVDHRSELRRPSHNRLFQVNRTIAPAVPLAAEDTLGDGANFTDVERARLSKLSDALIPPVLDHPAPSEVGIGGRLLDQVVAARPDLCAALHRALRVVPGTDLLRWMESIGGSDRGAKDALELAIAGGYYMSPEVRRAINYAGQVATTPRKDSYQVYFDEGLLDHLLK
jgi:choline dehydrogenase-like flavoprotein